MTQPGDGRGGYRAPSNPAPASGPGRLSRRTDGQPLQQLPDAAYGEQKTFREAQKTAPMAEASSGGGPSVSPLDMSRITPLNAPSQFPDEPITAGADVGPGPSSSVLRQPSNPGWENLVEMLPSFEIMAQMPNATDEFRDFVRMVRGLS